MFFGGTLPDLRARYRVVDVLWRWRVPLLVAVATLIGVAIAYRSRPVILGDDAAITMRYARRIADGKGWTYNDGDRTNGASAPLYTMVLAAMDFVGIHVMTAARIVGSLALAATFGLVAFLGSRIAGFVAGAIATIFLFSWIDFQAQALGGMESSLAVALGLGVIVALREDRDAIAGVLLGLALVNKLDAGLLAAAVAVAYLAVLRRPPWRVAWISAAVFAPWVLFATFYFGSPLPYSFTQKASDQVSNPANPFDRTWIVDIITGQQMMLVVLLGVAALAAIPVLARTKPRAALALGVCIAWPFFHGLTFSLLDLGDRHPWYLTAIYPATTVAAGCALALLLKAIARSSRVLGVTVTAAVVAVAIGLPNPGLGHAGYVAEEIVQGHEMTEWESFESARRAAGQAVAEIAEPDDVIATCYGWIAYEAYDNTIDETCPLNTRKEVAPPRYGIMSTYPGTEMQPLGDATLVESFISEVGQGGRLDIVEYPGFDD